MALSMKRWVVVVVVAVATLMNVRTLTGWTTDGHTHADVAVYAYGPGEDRFVGHFTNEEVGREMREVFGVEGQVEREQERLREMFVEGELVICDDTHVPDWVEWKKNVSYPEGNLLFPGYCVEEYKT